MKNLALSILVLAAVSIFISSCGDQNTVPVSSNSENQQTDVPCSPSSTIYVGNDDIVGIGHLNFNIVGSTLFITLKDSLPLTIHEVHILVSPTLLTGNLAPGQFPIHLTTLVKDSTYSFNIGFTPGCIYYLYIHFDLGSETGWAGNKSANHQVAGHGHKWMWWNTNPCQCFDAITH